MTQEKIYQCFNCGKEIIFDNNFVSKTGKKIPLGKSSKRPHRCKAKPYNRETRRDWWENQRRRSEQKREQAPPREEYYSYSYSSKQDHYHRVLGVQKGCTEQELKNAWRKKMLEYHPDRNHSPDADERTREIIEAYENIVP